MWISGSVRSFAATVRVSVSGMSTARFLQRCLDDGVDPQTAIKMAFAFEEEMGLAMAELAAENEERKAKQRERKQRSRASHAMSRDVTGPDVTLSKTKVSPTPPSKTQPIPNTPSPPKGGSVPKFSIRFDDFWSAYPRKEAKGAARTAYEKACRKIGGDDPAETLLAALALARERWEDPKFIPHPATWLNQERWTDQTEVAEPKSIFSEGWAERQQARIEAYAAQAKDPPDHGSDEPSSGDDSGDFGGIRSELSLRRDGGGEPTSATNRDSARTLKNLLGSDELLAGLGPRAWPGAQTRRAGTA